MICFECAKTKDTVAAVAICQHCEVGLCFRHQVPQVYPLVDVPADIAVGARRQTVGVV